MGCELVHAGDLLTDEIRCRRRYKGNGKSCVNIGEPLY